MGYTKKILAFGVATCGLVALLSTNPPHKKLFDGEVNGRRAVLYSSDWNSPSMLEVYSSGKPNATLDSVYEDWDGNGIIGNNSKDKVTLYLPEGKVTITKKNVTDYNGSISPTDEGFTEDLNIASMVYKTYLSKIWYKRHGQINA